MRRHIPNPLAMTPAEIARAMRRIREEADEMALTSDSPEVQLAAIKIRREHDRLLEDWRRRALDERVRAAVADLIS